MQLPSQECYKIIQDKKGYIWFSTDNGLCRYENGSLKIFNKTNGLPELNVYCLAEDDNGRIWLATSANRILYIENDTLTEAPFSKDYQKVPNKYFSFPTPSFLDVSDPENTFIANSYYTVKVNQKNNTCYKIPETHATNDVQYFKISGHPFVPNRFMKKDNTNVSVELNNEGKTKKIILTTTSANKFFHWNTSSVFSKFSNTDFIGIQNFLFKINSDLSHSVFNLPERILNSYIDKSGGLWVGVLNNGVYYYPDVKNMAIVHHNLKGFSVTGICEDNEGGVWCTTLEKGIFYCKNKQLFSYTSFNGLNRLTTLLKYTSDGLFASSHSKAVYQFKGEMYQAHTFPTDNIHFTDILHEKKTWVLTGWENTIRTDNAFHLLKTLKERNHYNVSCDEIAFGEDSTIYGILTKTFKEINQSDKIKVVGTNEGCSAKSFLHLSGSRFLLGGDQGLFEYDIKSLTFNKIKGSPEKIRKIIKSRSGRVWIATKNDGVYWLDNGKVRNANQILHLKNTVLNDLTEDVHGDVWAGSNEGLYHFKKDAENYITTCYTISHGLPSNEVYKVAANEDKIWFSTFEGLFSLPLAGNSLNSTGPAIHLQKLSVNNKAIADSSRTYSFSYNHNNFRFAFDILTFKNGTNTKLEYHLNNGEQSTVTKLDGNEVFLENLDPGKYELCVYGVNNDGIKSSHPEIFKITIDPPFWRTWWFILIAFILMILIILVVIRYIVQRIQKKEAAKTEVNKLMAEYQITALQAQMNPHFIFNAINTIQGYILEKNEDEAYNYLSKFGKLIRKVLHHSQQRILALDQELEVLNLYIELEQLRFDNCFDYELTISENVIPEDVYLPGMILQPYVENAIWHGIVNLNGARRGKLSITMLRDNDILIVTIADNGIGREMALGFNKDRRHKSVGMQLTKERLDAMNQFHGYEMAHVTITDLFDEDKQASGTSVEVKIPINTEL
jgi:ligand-binding sensor domain-containing protein